MTHRCKNITLPQTSFAGSINARSRQVLVVNELSNFAGNVCSTVTELVVRGTECNLAARSPYRSPYTLESYRLMVRIPTDFRHVDLLKDTEERAPEAGGDAGAREALSRHGRVGDQICKHT